MSEWKNVQFPEKGLVFDYYVDEAQCLMVPWDDKVSYGLTHQGLQQKARVHVCNSLW